MGEKINIEATISGTTPDKKKKLVVEIGTGIGVPFFVLGQRKLAKDEAYVSVDIDKESARNTKQLIEKPGVSDTMQVNADAKNLPFADGTVDELIFNNLFGDPRTKDKEAILKESARVLKRGGKITITENYTPDGVPHTMQPKFGADGNFIVKEDYYRKFGLRTVKISKDKADINQHHTVYPKLSNEVDFQLTLIKD